MHNLDILYDLIGQYGLYAVFILVMIEGDITLLIAGVLAHSYFFERYSFGCLCFGGTFVVFVSDNLVFFAGRPFRKPVKDFLFYRAPKPKIERLTNRFGPSSFFLSK